MFPRRVKLAYELGRCLCLNYRQNLRAPTKPCAEPIEHRPACWNPPCASAIDWSSSLRPAGQHHAEPQHPPPVLHRLRRSRPGHRRRACATPASKPSPPGTSCFPQPKARSLKQAGESIGARVASSAADAAQGADIIISAVTAASSLEAAQSVAPHLTGNPYFLDINSVSPGRKKETEKLLGAKARYVDVAILAPIHPARHQTPLLLAGPHAAGGHAAADRRAGNARRHRRRRGRPGRRPEDDPQRDDQGHRGADPGMLPRRQARRHRRRGRRLA